LVLIGAALHAGCIEDIIRSKIPVFSDDLGTFAPEAGLPTDGLATEKLTIIGVKPEHGPYVGGTTVVITGSGFTKQTIVRFGGKGVQPNQFTLLSPMFLKVITPAGAVGPADVQVSLDQQTSILEKGFHYDRVYLDPDSGPTAGSTLVTIRGKETLFKKGMALSLGGQAMTGVEVLSPTSMRAKTPAGATGLVDLVISGPKETYKEAYTYYNAANPKSGGLGGGPLKGTLTVTVLNWLTRATVSDAKVVLQKERSLTLTNTTNIAGAAVFSQKDLLGPVSVTVGKQGYETSTLLSFDARDLTIFLMPIPKPKPGPYGPGQRPGYIQGHLLFGGATGVGNPQWKLVPEPKTNQIKRTYIYTSLPYMSWGPPSLGSGDYVDFTSGGATAWPFTLYTYTGALAVFAFAGIYDKSTGTFEPYAMGITRGVAVGPGEVVDADIHVTIPLTQKVAVRLKQLPAGVNHHQVTLAIDLGADGLIMRQDLQVTGDGTLQQKTFGRLPSFSHQGLFDATYTVEVLLDTVTEEGLPLSMATERLRLPKDGVIEVDRFVGPPLQVKPRAGGSLQGNTLSWKSSGHPPNMAVTLVQMTDETPVWRIIGPGVIAQAKLPDPKSFGLPGWPKGPAAWSQWLVYLPGFSFNNYSYTHLSSRYWSRYSYNEFSFKVP